MSYPKELYTDEYYRLVHGPEEDKEFQAKGWVDQMPEGHPYVPHTAAGMQVDAPKKRGPGRPKAE